MKGEEEGMVTLRRKSGERKWHTERVLSAGAQVKMAHFLFYISAKPNSSKTYSAQHLLCGVLISMSVKSSSAGFICWLTPYVSFSRPYLCVRAPGWIHLLMCSSQGLTGLFEASWDGRNSSALTFLSSFLTACGRPASRLSFRAASAIYSHPAFAEMSPSSSAVSITSDGNLLVQPESAAGGSPPGNNIEEAGCVAAEILWELNAYTGPEILEMRGECNAEGKLQFCHERFFDYACFAQAFSHREPDPAVWHLEISDALKILDHQWISSFGWNCFGGLKMITIYHHWLKLWRSISASLMVCFDSVSVYFVHTMWINNDGLKG